ncbi:MAG: acyl carrier protein [Pseudomonadales bacterium]
MTSQEQIFSQLVTILEELFEIDPSTVSMETEFYEDLDIDSIDAVDMMVRVKETSGHRLDPDVFKNVRTVGDCVSAIHALYLEADNET